jgi:hypothetical protein
MPKAVNAFTLALVMLCVLLLGVVIVELFNPPRLGQLPGVPFPPASPVAELDVEKFPIRRLNQYDEIVERPLFLASRRPPEEREEAPQSRTAEEELRLLGVLLAPQRIVALLQVDSSGKTARLEVGEKANGWQLETISARSVSLRRGDRVKNLQLVRNTKTAVRADKMAVGEKTTHNSRSRGAGAAPRGTSPH